MVSFLQSNKALIAALLASLATTGAAYGRYYLGSRPSMALGSRMLLPTRVSRPSPFSQDIQRLMNGFDEMFGSVFDGVDDMFYEPFQLQHMSRPSYLLQGPSPALNALAATRRAENAFGITQDDKQFKIALDVPGAKASDINLQLEDDGHVLRISGETKREEEGVSVHSRFDRAFSLNRDVDTSKISARIDNGVLTITAPKYQEVKETVRRIDIVENNQIESPEATEQEEVVASSSSEKNQPSKPEIDDSVIDLDVSKE